MKKSKQINLTRMRKRAAVLHPKPLAVAVAASIMLTGCGSSEKEVAIYQSVEECVIENPDMDAQCREAFDKAQTEAVDTAPKYRTIEDCVAEFGSGMCRRDSGNNWFYPAMAGFMFGRMLDNNRHYGYRSTPIFTSRSYRSPYRDTWITADGYSYGSTSSRKTYADNRAFKPKPKVAKTISRGGFGSTAVAKSSWGKSSSRSWGG